MGFFVDINNIWWWWWMENVITNFVQLLLCVCVFFFWCSNEEFWDPVMDGLEPIVVKRNIPCVHILMSLDEIDSKTPG